MENKTMPRGNAMVNYLRNSWQELKKVVWPTRQETTRQTIVVIAVSITTAIFLGILDFAFQQIVERIV